MPWKRWKRWPKIVKVADLPPTTIELLDVRIGQVNGCSVCVDMHSRALKAPPPVK